MNAGNITHNGIISDRWNDRADARVHYMPVSAGVKTETRNESVAPTYKTRWFFSTTPTRQHEFEGHTSTDTPTFRTLTSCQNPAVALGKYRGVNDPTTRQTWMYIKEVRDAKDDDYLHDTPENRLRLRQRYKCIWQERETTTYADTIVQTFDERLFMPAYVVYFGISAETVVTYNDDTHDRTGWKAPEVKTTMVVRVNSKRTAVCQHEYALITNGATWTDGGVPAELPLPEGIPYNTRITHEDGRDLSAHNRRGMSADDRNRAFTMYREFLTECVHQVAVKCRTQHRKFDARIPADRRERFSEFRLDDGWNGGRRVMEIVYPLVTLKDMRLYIHNPITPFDELHGDERLNAEKKRRADLNESITAKVFHPDRVMRMAEVYGEDWIERV